MNYDTGNGGGAMSAAAIVNALCADPNATAKLADEIAAALVAGGFAETLIKATERVMMKSQRVTPGRLLAGTVTALQAMVVGTTPPYAMVKLGGATTPTKCYVPDHIIPDLATTQDVWVEPVNGRMDDLMVVAIRANKQTPVASQALTNAAAAQSTANSKSQLVWLSAPQGAGEVSVLGTTTPLGVHTFNAVSSGWVPSGTTAILCYASYQTASVPSSTATAFMSVHAGVNNTTAPITASWQCQVANVPMIGNQWAELDASGNFTVSDHGTNAGQLNFFKILAYII